MVFRDDAIMVYGRRRSLRFVKKMFLLLYRSREGNDGNVSVRLFRVCKEGIILNFVESRREEVMDNLLFFEVNEIINVYLLMGLEDIEKIDNFVIKEDMGKEVDRIISNVIIVGGRNYLEGSYF